VSDERLRELLALAAEPARDDEVRALSALYAGRRLRRVRRVRQVGATLGSSALVVAATVALQVPTAVPASAEAVVPCSSHTGGGRPVLASGGLDGVTVTVDNPTAVVATVTAAGTTALAMPGRTQVTLPLVSGEQVRCGEGAPVRVTFRPTPRTALCTTTGTVSGGSLWTGSLVDLTRRQLGELPPGAAVTELDPTGPLHRVRVESAGRVLAEALWHEMPARDTWQLESLTICGT
jgi:hypothetical protein